MKDEDQLLRLINRLYEIDVRYVGLYEFVCFANASVACVTEFAEAICIEDMNSAVWQKVAARLKCEVRKTTESGRWSRYTKRGLSFEASGQREFAGIIDYLRTKSNGKVDDEINFMSSSNDGGDYPSYVPRTVALFDDHSKCFVSGNKPGSWICLDFKEHRVIPTDYTIRSCDGGTNNHHLKSWVVECSNDNNEWKVVDERENESSLNGPLCAHIFKIQQGNSEEYR